MLHSLSGAIKNIEANSFPISMSGQIQTQPSGCLKKGNSEELPLTKKATPKSYL